jgi:hypothetical protein
MLTPRHLLSVLALALFAAAPARAENVATNFTVLGTATAPSMTFGVMTLTGDSGSGPAGVHMLNLNGLGVVGGISAAMVDGAEVLSFRFEAAARNVVYTVFVANNLDADAFVGESFIEVFSGATSLGVFPTHDTGFKNVSALVGNVPITGFDVIADVDGVRIDTLTYSTNWDNLGNALAGSTGLPLLTGKGTMLPGDTVTLALSNALPSTTSYLIIGFSLLNLPFKGGVMVPAAVAPNGLFLTLPVSGTGTLTLASPWPTGIPSNTLLYLKHWIVDGAGPVGFAASNAVRGRTF